eukprot:TRINITY_DN692_c0_g1_i5.p1 TRINITY_DN692_c0_g1~~TRINITY_DN692_c0_g1_i5.p1  ORF type:complete len:164 (+),score=47.73 TRINITY_DN692_c0_g1_i5:44-535(+)
MEVESDLVRLQQQFASLEAKYHEVQGKYVLCKSEKERLMKENGYLKKTRQRFSPEVEGEVEILRSKLASSEAVAKKYATWTADLFKHMESARTAMTESFSSGEKKIKDLQDEVDSLKLENEKLKGVDIPVWLCSYSCQHSHSLHHKHVFVVSSLKWHPVLPMG